MTPRQRGHDPNIFWVMTNHFLGVMETLGTQQFALVFFSHCWLLGDF